MNWKTVAKRGAIGAVVLFAGIQLVPYGRAHENPAVTRDADWPDPAAGSLARAACYDCHSNETVWPWYSHVAPVSWAVQHHVDEGRSKLNFSELDRPQRDADEAAEVVREGEMPLAPYLPAHPEAQLSDAQRETLAAALDAMFGEASHEHAD